MLGEGRVSELLLLGGETAARVSCAPGLVPTPGQYVLAHADGSDAPLAAALFAARTYPDGFLTAGSIPSTWVPGTQLHLRGPLGHGFSMPPGARRITLAAFACSPQTLLSLLEPAVRQGASVVLVSDRAPDDLALDVEAHPPSALRETCRWADYIAFDVARDALPELKDMLEADRLLSRAEGQALVRAPMPCGALAACGACTVEVRG